MTKEALHTVVGSTVATDKAKKIKREAAVATSPTIPAKALKSLVSVSVLEHKTGVTSIFSGFAASMPIADGKSVQVIVCPATHNIIAGEESANLFSASVNIALDNGFRVVPLKFFKQWTYSIGKFTDTCTAFLFEGGGLKMFKAPLTHATPARTVAQGLIYSPHTTNTSGGQFIVDAEGFLIHQIGTKPGDSGSFVWSTVLTEARTAITVPVGVHVGNRGANLAVPVGVVFRDVNFL